MKTPLIGCYLLLRGLFSCQLPLTHPKAVSKDRLVKPRSEKIDSKRSQENSWPYRQSSSTFPLHVPPLSMSLSSIREQHQVVHIYWWPLIWLRAWLDFIWLHSVLEAAGAGRRVAHTERKLMLTWLLGSWCGFRSFTETFKGHQRWERQPVIKQRPDRDVHVSGRRAPRVWFHWRWTYRVWFV